MYFILVSGDKGEIGIGVELRNDNFANLCITTVNGAVMRLQTFGRGGGLNVDGVAAFEDVVAVYVAFFMLGSVAHRAFIVSRCVVVAVCIGRSGEIPAVIGLDPGFICNEVSIIATRAIVLRTLGVAFCAATCNRSCNVIVCQRLSIVYNVNVRCVARADVGGVAVGTANGSCGVGTFIVIVCKRFAGFEIKGIVALVARVGDVGALTANGSLMEDSVGIVVSLRDLIYHNVGVGTAGLCALISGGAELAAGSRSGIGACIHDMLASNRIGDNVGVVATGASVGRITLGTAGSSSGISTLVEIVAANLSVYNDFGMVAIKARVGGKALRIAGGSVGMNACIHDVSLYLSVFNVKGVGAVRTSVGGSALRSAIGGSVGGAVFVCFGDETVSGLHVAANGTGVFSVVAEATENGLHALVICMYLAGGDGRRTGRGKSEVIQTALVATTPKGTENQNQKCKANDNSTHGDNLHSLS